MNEVTAPPRSQVFVQLDDVVAVFHRWRQTLPNDRPFFHSNGVQFLQWINELPTALPAGRLVDPSPLAQESAERTLKSIAAMLGWMNVPPRETLEREIATLKARAARVDPTREKGIAMTYREEAEKVTRNLKGDANQIAHYLIERCGQFIYDHQRESFIAEFLRAALLVPTPFHNERTNDPSK